ncbi:hypothetical protein HGRIS_007902 [Hohenbuehelia grisea]|uniref:Uncharacterized protein n=1 Tax=Hohenbuehelia grisea TaxID=104357 RepID=A0ABR3J6P5_9AGAR
MSSSNFASFAPYAPPPDEPAPSSQPIVRPWFPSQSGDAGTSYQSGGIPTFNASMSGGGPSHAEEAEGQINQWETRYGMRVDMLAAVAYLLGPISALLVLIIETQNDYVRFHAYQSALFSTPLVIIRMIASLLQFAPWLRTFFTLILLASFLYMAFRAYYGAAHDGLSRYYLPYLGPLADQWLADE